MNLAGQLKVGRHLSGFVKILEMKYGYVKYTDQYAKSNIWDKEQVRNVFEKSGYGRGMGKDFLKMRYGYGNKRRKNYVMFKILIFSKFLTEMSAKVYATTLYSKTGR